MAGLEGTIKLPGVGPVQKKTVLYGAVAVVAMGVVVAYRHKQAAASDASVSAQDAEIDPATGYPYGSPEDAAALAAQGNYVSPTDVGGGASGGGSSSIPTTGTGYVSNGAWVQGVIQYMLANNLVEDPSQLSAALGVYITGAYATDTQVSLINQAIAVQGYPPVAGPTGQPPGINRNPPQTGGGTTTTPPKLVAPTGLHASVVGPTSMRLDWNDVTGSRGYRVGVNGAYNSSPVLSQVELYGLKKNTTYTVTVQAINSVGGAYGPSASAKFKTKAS